MSGASEKRNVHYENLTDYDDRNSENEDKVTISEEEFTSHLDYDAAPQWEGSDLNTIQPSYEILTQRSPLETSHELTKSGADNSPLGADIPPNSDHSDIYSSINDYRPKEAANCDVALAQASIDQAIEKYELNQFAHDTEPKSEFSIVSLGILNLTFNALHIREKTAMFELFSRLKQAMGNALSACLHAALFEKVIQLKMLWPDIARHIGITEPTIPTTNYIGSSGYWYILDSERRRRFHSSINAEITEFQHATGKILLSGIKEDACAIYDTFQHMYNTRFNTTVNNEGWFTLATQDAVIDLVDAKTPRKTINEKLHQFKNNLIEMVDSIADILIVFVLPMAKDTNRLLLREFFANGSTKYLTVQLPHFNIRLKIHREDITMHGSALKQPPTPSDRINPITTHRDSEPTRSGQGEQPTPPENTSTRVKPTVRSVGSKDSLGTRQFTDVTPLDKRMRAGQDKGAVTSNTPKTVPTSTTTPSGKSQVGSTTRDTTSRDRIPKGAPYDPNANPKGTSRMVEVTGQATHNSSVPLTTTTKPQPPLLPSQTVCGYDRAGCTKIGCTFIHQATLKWLCSKFMEKHPKYTCSGKSCKFLHPQQASVARSTDTIPTQSSDNTRGRNTRGSPAEAEKPHPSKRQRQSSYLDSVNQAASKDNTMDSESDVSQSEIRDEFYLSDVVSNVSNLNVHYTPLKSNPSQNNHPLTGPSTSLADDTERHPKRVRRWRITPEEECSRCLKMIAMNVMNVGVHVIHKDIILSENETCVLSLGTNFVPATRKAKQSIISDALLNFIRRIRLKKHFATLEQECDNTVTAESILRTRVNKTLPLPVAELRFTPTITKSPIEQYIADISTKITLENDRLVKVNRLERKKWAHFYNTVTRLQNRTDIIIKPADKNLGIAVMRREWYVSEALSTSYLGDVNTYQEVLNHPPLEPIVEKLSNICETQNWLTQAKTQKLYDDLTIDYKLNRVKLCRMYFMPKLHKPKLALRPICASIGWITYWTSVYIHVTVFPLLRLIPTYLSNSTELVALIEQIKPPSEFIFLEADVENLYPSIDINDGIQALFTFLQKVSNFPKARIVFILKLTHWVLTNNYVAFGEKTFLQIKGTAMGTPCAVIFACIYMHILEQEAWQQFLMMRHRNDSIILFFRWLDDIIAIVNNKESGLALMEILNSRRPSIKLTFKLDEREATFLDLTLYKTVTGDKIAVKAFSKPNNKFLFLPPTSCHPKHIFMGWITGYGRRLSINCTEPAEYQKNLEAFRQRLQARGYTTNLINAAFAAIPNRESILKDFRQQKKQPLTRSNHSVGIPFVVTYSPAIKEALPHIRKALSLKEIASMDPHFPLLFGNKDTPLIAFKRSSNLRDLLAPSTLK